MTTAFVALALVAGACVPPKQGPPPPAPLPPPPSQYCHPSTPTDANGYRAAFDGLRAVNANFWVAMDIGVPFRLPNGRTLWMFGDIVLGRWQPGGSVNPFLGVINNGFVVQNGPCFTPRNTPIPNQAGEWMWPSDAVLDHTGKVLLVFGYRVRKAGNSFQVRGVDVARFSLPGLGFIDRRPMPIPTAPPGPRYGEAVTVVTDAEGTWVYAYGTRFVRTTPEPFAFPVHNQYLARAKLDQVLTPSAWEFWTPGLLPENPLDDWVSNANDAVPLVFDRGEGEPPHADQAPAAAFPVTTLSGGSLLGSAFQWDVAGRKIETWDATLPQGPWVKRAQIAVDVSGSVPSPSFPYGGQVVLDLPGVAPTALWSVNRVPIDTVLSNPNLYKVHFARPAPASYSNPP